jgi:hypothetical protein
MDSQSLVKFWLSLGMCLILPLTVVALIAVLVMSAARLRRQVHAAYDAFAKRVGGRIVNREQLLAVVQPLEIRFQHGKSPCSLWIDVEYTGERHSDHPGMTYFTRMTFDLGRETPFTCRIEPQWMPRILAGVLRTSDVRLGWDEFDRRFVVRTSDELRAPDILHRPVQEQLLAISQAAAAMSPLEKGQVELNVSGRTLTIRMQGLLDEEQQLLPFYQLCGNLFDLLAPRLP